MKSYKNSYVVYHPSLTSAVQEVEKYIAMKGYEVSADELFDKVGTGPKKPSRGKTNRYHLKLTKNGKDVKQQAHFQVYNRETEQNPYELNLYIS